MRQGPHLVPNPPRCHLYTPSLALHPRVDVLNVLSRSTHLLSYSTRLDPPGESIQTHV